VLSWIKESIDDNDVTFVADDTPVGEARTTASARDGLSFTGIVFDYDFVIHVHNRHLRNGSLHDLVDTIIHELLHVHHYKRDWCDRFHNDHPAAFMAAVRLATRFLAERSEKMRAAIERDDAEAQRQRGGAEQR
jgi:hypothetical protein